MRILLTNDDGINSAGLKLLKDFAVDLGFTDIWVVAPSADRSANSHCVTLNKPMSLIEIADKTYILDGTPADCMIVALKKIFKNERKPDYIFSGINIGANVGIDTIYSGTVAAAMEGLFFGITSIAFSQLYDSSPEKIKWYIDNEELKQFIKNIIKAKADGAMKKAVFENGILSINLPVKPAVGLKFLQQGTNKWSNMVSHKTTSNYIEEGAGQNKHQIMIHCAEQPINCEALDENYITITPIGYDLTNYKALEYLNNNKI